MTAPYRFTLRSSLASCVAIVLVLTLPACGRRGPLEAPPDASAPASPARAPSGKAAPADKRLRRDATSQSPNTVDPMSRLPGRSAGIVQDTPDDPETDDEDEPEQGSLLVNPQPTPSRKRGRAYTVPKEPFFLDPLL